ncbi:hypothetical protein EP56_08145 [Listeriaceae bacterium FSL A5-0209]|nr:hypothetical protein EP56_08145 [Listeriaceae bacterium FSL A5-0209]
MMGLSNAQINLLRHALGLDNAKKAYRNYYAAVSTDAKEWEKLVEKGYAKNGVETKLVDYYHVSESGKRFLESIGIEGVWG